MHEQMHKQMCKANVQGRCARCAIGSREHIHTGGPGRPRGISVQQPTTNNTTDTNTATHAAAQARQAGQLPPESNTMPTPDAAGPFPTSCPPANRPSAITPPTDRPHGRSDSVAFEKETNPAAAHTVLRIDRNTHQSTPEAKQPTPSLQIAPQAAQHLAESDAICAQIRAHLINTQGHNKVRRYLSSTVTMCCLDANTVELVAGDRFTLDMIERRLGDPLRVAAQFALGTTTPRITYRVEPITDARTSTNNHPDTKPGRHAHAHTTHTETTHPLANRIPARRPAPQRAPLCPTLNDFLVGTSNRLAYESIKQVIQAGVDCPPIFIHGSCGVGKTHLLRGATHYARQLRPGCKVRYTTGEAFTNGFVTAIRTRSVEAFQKKYRGLDLLCIDDIHLMAGKQATQHELLQIFNKLSLGGCTIILASDAHPREITRLDQALTSRFSAGLVVKVDEPDLELARRLVPHIATRRGVFLDAPAIQTIVDRVGIGRGASVRDLEGAILQIQAIARLMDQSNGSGNGSSNGSSNGRPATPRTPTMTHIRKALSLRDGASTQSTTGPIALETIISRICQEMTVSKSDLIGKGRQKKVVMARELIVHTARNLTSKSFPEIAHAIGRPNHSTVITAAKRFKDRITAGQPIAVGCPHDGLPAGELAELFATAIRS